MIKTFVNYLSKFFPSKLSSYNNHLFLSEGKRGAWIFFETACSYSVYTFMKKLLQWNFCVACILNIFRLWWALYIDTTVDIMVLLWICLCRCLAMYVYLIMYFQQILIVITNKGAPCFLPVGHLFKTFPAGSIPEEIF